MTPIRRDSLLAGQSAVAQKVYSAVPIRTTFTVGEIAGALKKQTGAGLDIRTLRGCLGMLTQSGLVREPVSGSLRRADVKEKETIDMPNPPSLPDTQRPPTPARHDPIDVWAGIAARLRVLADDIDAAALAAAARGQADIAELEKFNQLKALLKGSD